MTGTKPLQVHDGALEELDGADAEARQAIAEADLLAVLPLAKRLTREAGLEFDPKTKASKTFMLALLRGRRELLMLERARVLGDYGATPSDPPSEGHWRSHLQAPRFAQSVT